MTATNILISSGSIVITDTAGYLAGAIISVLILGYLIYSLIRPEKF